jgi:hypothetical protein
VTLAQRAAEHREILGEGIDQPAVDRARSADDAVAGDLLRLHPEVGAIMLDEHVIFFEAAGIEQDRQPLASGQPALGVLRRDPLLAAAAPRQLAPRLELLDRGCHLAARPHLIQAGPVLPRARQPVNRAFGGHSPSVRLRMGTSRVSGLAVVGNGSANVALHNRRFCVNPDQYRGTVTACGPFIPQADTTRRTNGKC